MAVAKARQTPKARPFPLEWRASKAKTVPKRAATAPTRNPSGKALKPRMSVLPLSPLTKTPRAAVADAPRSELGKAMRVKGALETDGDLFVHGLVLGRIRAARVIVGIYGTVEGDVVAREVRVKGRFNGRIFALAVTLEATADVSGRVFHSSVEVEKGARIDARMPWRPPSYFETLDQLPETRS
jgi:cytoskeletal protein CcmA (bactofilin family)